MTMTERLRLIARMRDLIRRKATGTPEEFQQKIGLTRPTFYRYLELLKDDEHGGDIVYDRERGCYRFEEPGDRLDIKNKNMWRGGGDALFLDRKVF